MISWIYSSSTWNFVYFDWFFSFLRKICCQIKSVSCNAGFYDWIPIFVCFVTDLWSFCFSRPMFGIIDVYHYAWLICWFLFIKIFKKRPQISIYMEWECRWKSEDRSFIARWIITRVSIYCAFTESRGLWSLFLPLCLFLSLYSAGIQHHAWWASAMLLSYIPSPAFNL
jgi:hypothetical protein